MTPYQLYMAKAAASIDDDRMLNPYTVTGAAAGVLAGGRMGYGAGTAAREGNAKRLAGHLQELGQNHEGSFVVPHAPESSIKHVASLGNQVYAHNAFVHPLPRRLGGAGAIGLGLAGAVPGVALGLLNKVERATGGAP